MAAQAGFFDFDERMVDLSAHGDPLERIAAVVDFEVFRADLNKALGRAEGAKGAKRGVWQGQFVMPWDWRRGKR